MSILRVEFTVTDFARWKEVFDSDPADRAGSGVRAYSVLQAADDPNFVVVNLKFDSPEAARAFDQKVAQAISSAGQGIVLSANRRIFSKVEHKELAPKESAQPAGA